MTSSSNTQFSGSVLVLRHIYCSTDGANHNWELQFCCKVQIPFPEKFKTWIEIQDLEREIQGLIKIKLPLYVFAHRRSRSCSLFQIWMNHFNLDEWVWWWGWDYEVWYIFSSYLLNVFSFPVRNLKSFTGYNR